MTTNGTLSYAVGHTVQLRPRTVPPKTWTESGEPASHPSRISLPFFQPCKSHCKPRWRPTELLSYTKIVISGFQPSRCRVFDLATQQGLHFFVSTLICGVFVVCVSRRTAQCPGKPRAPRLALSKCGISSNSFTTVRVQLHTTVACCLSFAVTAGACHTSIAPCGAV
jgi:hypothetical protein